MKKSDFGENFRWGTATAAYQIEGAHNEDGKGESIWDRFTGTKKKIKNGDTGNTACDHYHRYESDIEIIRSLNIPNYRFSLAWTRILPDGKGAVNEKGLDFYKRLIETCHKNGVEPNVTLYHWDLPQKLQDTGGWTSRDTYKRFLEYTDIATSKLDGVNIWMILNEPLVFTAGGYLIGVHAPGKKGMKNFLPAAHHASLAQSEGARIVRKNRPDAVIGTTFSCSHIEPFNNKPRHVTAAARFDAIINRLFIEPACGLGYPVETVPALKKIEKHIQPGDMEKLPYDFDFIGLQNYTREIVRYMPLMPVVRGRIIPARKRVMRTTEMGWEIYPEGIYHLLKKFAAYDKVKKIMVTENGAAFPDIVENGRVHDKDRIHFLEQYMGAVLKAKQEGVPVEGYYVWSLMDNFEWAEGYRPRFGLVYIDYSTQERIIKDSGMWYRDFLA